jgi:hypothetical protein
MISCLTMSCSLNNKSQSLSPCCKKKKKEYIATLKVFESMSIANLAVSSVGDKLPKDVLALKYVSIA